jgi:hypothetical protein
MACCSFSVEFGGAASAVQSSNTRGADDAGGLRLPLRQVDEPTASRPPAAIARKEADGGLGTRRVACLAVSHTWLMAAEDAFGGGWEMSEPSGGRELLIQESQSAGRSAS